MMRTSTRTRSPSPTRLHLLQLETRDTPAGTVTGTMSGGVLTLTGDDDSNAIQLIQVGTTITVTGTGGTNVIGGPFLNVTSVKTLMKGGNDDVSIGPIGPFALTGAATFDLGDGNNTLTLSTTGQIALGSLTVKAGDGIDAINVSGIAGSNVNGNATLNLGAGGVNVQVTNLAVHGAGGLKVTSTDGNDDVNLTTCEIDKQFNVSAGNGSLGVTANVSIFGSMSFSSGGSSPSISDQGLDAQLIGATVTGAVTLKSTEGADLNIAGGSTGNVSVTAGPLAQARLTFPGTTTVNGGLTVKGLDAQLSLNTGSNVTVTKDIAVLGTRFGQANINGGILLGRGLKVTGSVPIAAPGGPVTIVGSAVTVTNDITVKGARADFVLDSSSVNAHSVSLTGTESAAFRPPAAPLGGASLSLSGSLTVSAPEASFVWVDGSAVASGNVKIAGTRETTFNFPAGQVSATGAMSVLGGSGILNFVVVDGSLDVGTDLTVKGEAPNAIQLTPTVPSTIGRNMSVTLGKTDDRLEVNSNVKVTGNLTVNAGAGNNIVQLGAPGAPAGPTVGKNLSITTLGGNDLVALSQVTVTGTTSINTGAGTDLLQMNGPSTFTGATTINLGAGDDTWNAANDPGTTTDRVRFAGTVNAKLGAGNDTLRLGLADASGGNAATTVDFASTGVNKIDGGTGLNLYDNEAAKLTGTVTIVNFTDPTP